MTSTDTNKVRSSLLFMLVNKCFRLCARAPQYDAARGLIYIDHQGTYIVFSSQVHHFPQTLVARCTYVCGLINPNTCNKNEATLWTVIGTSMPPN
jgi:hypothetical protein